MYKVITKHFCCRHSEHIVREKLIKFPRTIGLLCHRQNFLHVKTIVQLSLLRLYCETFELFKRQHLRVIEMRCKKKIHKLHGILAPKIWAQHRHHKRNLIRGVQRNTNFFSNSYLLLLSIQ